MAKKKTQQHDSFEGFEGALTRTEQFIEDNQKTLTYIVLGIVAVVVIYIGFKRFYLAPLEEEARSQMFVAEKYFEQDSFNLALMGDGQYLGFLDIIDEYKITKSANLAKYYAGISYLRLGQYEDAIEYLKSFKSSDKMVAPIAEGAIGDAYVELEDMETGVKQYMKAANMCDNNLITPRYLMKAAQVYEELAEYQKAVENYERIQKEYLDFANRENIEKYLTRARILAETSS